MLLCRYDNLWRRLFLSNEIALGRRRLTIHRPVDSQAISTMRCPNSSRVSDSATQRLIANTEAIGRLAYRAKLLAADYWMCRKPIVERILKFCDFALGGFAVN